MKFWHWWMRSTAALILLLILLFATWVNVSEEPRPDGFSMSTDTRLWARRPIILNRIGLLPEIEKINAVGFDGDILLAGDRSSVYRLYADFREVSPQNETGTAGVPKRNAEAFVYLYPQSAIGKSGYRYGGDYELSSSLPQEARCKDTRYRLEGKDVRVFSSKDGEGELQQVGNAGEVGWRAIYGVNIGGQCRVVLIGDKGTVREHVEGGEGWRKPYQSATCKESEEEARKETTWTIQENVDTGVITKKIGDQKSDVQLPMRGRWKAIGVWPWMDGTTCTGVLVGEKGEVLLYNPARTKADVWIDVTRGGRQFDKRPNWLPAWLPAPLWLLTGAFSIVLLTFRLRWLPARLLRAVSKEATSRQQSEGPGQALQSDPLPEPAPAPRDLLPWVVLSLALILVSWWMSGRMSGGQDKAFTIDSWITAAYSSAERVWAGTEWGAILTKRNPGGTWMRTQLPEKARVLDIGYLRRSLTTYAVLGNGIVAASKRDGEWTTFQLRGTHPSPLTSDGKPVEFASAKIWDSNRLQIGATDRQGAFWCYDEGATGWVTGGSCNGSWAYGLDRGDYKNTVDGSLVGKRVREPIIRPLVRSWNISLKGKASPKQQVGLRIGGSPVVYTAKDGDGLADLVVGLGKAINKLGLPVFAEEAEELASALNVKTSIRGPRIEHGSADPKSELVIDIQAAEQQVSAVPRPVATGAWVILVVVVLGALVFFERARKAIFAFRQNYIESLNTMSVTDAAIRLPVEDRMGFWEDTKRFADAFVSHGAKLPLCLSVEGAWGSGKTSYMRLLEHRLRMKKARTVWINPWHHESEASLLSAVLEELRRNGPPPIYRWDGVRYRLRVLYQRHGLHWFLMIGGSVGMALSDPDKLARWTADLQVLIPEKSAITSLWKSLAEKLSAAAMLGGVSFSTLVLSLRRLYNLSAFVRTHLPERPKSRLTDAFLAGQISFRHRAQEELSQALRAVAPTRVVVFFDDLDRCSPKNLRTAIETCSFLSTAGPIGIVLGMSREQVESILATELGQSEAHVRLFLKKIIQAEIHVEEKYRRVEVSRYLDPLMSDEQRLSWDVELRAREMGRLARNLIVQCGFVFVGAWFLCLQWPGFQLLEPSAAELRMALPWSYHAAVASVIWILARLSWRAFHPQDRFIDSQGFHDAFKAWAAVADTQGPGAARRIKRLLVRTRVIACRLGSPQPDDVPHIVTQAALDELFPGQSIDSMPADNAVLREAVAFSKSKQAWPPDLLRQARGGQRGQDGMTTTQELTGPA